ncbi:MAG: hypothetical protein Q9184_007211 [Pyrenodesmia sp. 2 TL-2023]
MAAGMPVWVTRTFDFLTHPLGPQSPPNPMPSSRPQRAMLAQSESPARTRDGAERTTSRSRKTRSQARASRFPVNVSDPRQAAAILTTTLPVSYESRSTQTEELSNLQHRRLRSEDGSRSSPGYTREPFLSPRSWEPGADRSQMPSGGPDSDRMDVDDGGSNSKLKETEEQRPVPEDLEAYEPPPYTNGEAHVVLASDGMKECLALLLTSRLVATINQVGTRARRFNLVSTKLKEAKWSKKLDESSLVCKYEAVRDMNDQARLDRNKTDLEETQERIASAGEQIEALEKELETLKFNLAYLRDQSQWSLENALEKAGLLDVDGAGVDEETDPAHEPRGHSIEPASTDNDKREPTSDDSDEAATQEEFTRSIRQAARADFEAKREFLIAVDEAFDHRQENLAEEKAEYHRCVREGTCHITQTEFDLLALQDFRRMTADLRDAQEAFEESFKNAKQLGALDDRDAHYQESVFSNWSEGYPLSMEHAMVGSAPMKNIHRWQAGVPKQSLNGTSWQDLELKPWSDPVLDPQAQEMENCDLRSVAMSDSWSCVDLSRNRKRIDRWRAIAGRER